MHFNSLVWHLELLKPDPKLHLEYNLFSFPRFICPMSPVNLFISPDDT